MHGKGGLLMGGILPWLFGRQDVSLGGPSIYFGKVSSKFLICSTWMCFTSFSSSFVPFLPGAASPPGGPVPNPRAQCVTASLPAAKLLAQEGEAGGCFPLPDLVVELPCWKTLASSVSHTSAHPLLPWVSKVLCGKPEHLFCELGSWRKVGRDVLPALQ